MMWEYWLRERGTDCYCPIELDDEGHLVDVVIGMNMIGEPRGAVLGEFWLDENGDIEVKQYEAPQVFISLTRTKP